MEAPKRATKFAANDEWGKVYRNMFGVAKMNQSLSILTGATAGATEAFVVVPFELVKIRLQGMLNTETATPNTRTENANEITQTKPKQANTTASSTPSAKSSPKKAP